MISRLSIFPFVDLITAGGACCPAGGREVDAIGMMPSAANAGRELTGSWTGIAVLLIAERCAWACCRAWADADDVTAVEAVLAGGLYVVEVPEIGV